MALPLGSKVEMYFSDGHWYPGVITKHLKNKRFKISFEDGETEVATADDPDLRLPLSPPKQPTKGTRKARKRSRTVSNNENENPNTTVATVCTGIVGRDAEYRQIHGFVQRQLDKRKGNSLFICGCAGTGKTECVSNVINGLEPKKDRIKVVTLNGNTDLRSEHIYYDLLEKITGQRENSMEAARNRLARLFTTQKRRLLYVVVIDEIDRLVTKHQDVLYNLFDWPKRPGSCLVLLAIANSVNLHERFLPRLKSQKAEPEFLVFSAYNCVELRNILDMKLKQEGTRNRYQDSALELCARKIAAKSGDARMALNYCSLAWGVAQSSGATAVSIPHMSLAIRGSGQVENVRGLMQQSQYLLCAAFRFRLKHAKKQLKVASLHKSYVSMAKEWKLPFVRSRSEFDCLLVSLCDAGVVAVDKRCNRTNSRERPVCLNVSIDDVKHALSDNAPMQQVLKGKTARLHGANMYKTLT